MHERRKRTTEDKTKRGTVAATLGRFIALLTLLSCSEESKRRKIMNQEHVIRKSLFLRWLEQDLTQTPGRCVHPSRCAQQHPLSDPDTSQRWTMPQSGPTQPLCVPLG